MAHHAPELVAPSDVLHQHWENKLALLVTTVHDQPDTLVMPGQGVWDKYLPRDVDCTCLVTQSRLDLTNTDGSLHCPTCRAIKRFTKLCLTGYSSEFIIQSGRQAGQHRIVMTTPNVVPTLRWDTAADSRARRYLIQNPGAIACGTPNFPQLRCLQGDSFTINTIIMACLQDLFDDQSLPHGPRMLTASLCGTTGQRIYENRPVVPYQQFRQQASGPIILQYWAQMLTILLTANKYWFMHGAPTVESFIIDNYPSNYRYDNVIIGAPFTLRMAPLEHASIIINNVHIYSGDINTDNLISRIDIIPELETRVVRTQEGCKLAGDGKPGLDGSISYFRLSDNNKRVISYLRHAGITLYAGAYDTYCLIVATMLDPIVYEIVQQDVPLRMLWQQLWLPSELAAMEERIRGAHVSPFKVASVASIMEILRVAWLRCDILSHLFALLPRS